MILRVIIELEKNDILYNLSLEEWIMDHTFEPTLILWKNLPSVVIGKNQNPWLECKLKLMNKEKIPLARRISGGGTVYHDNGNLNYSVIVSQSEYRNELAFDMIINVLKSFDISAERKCKSNLMVDNKKFSGTAFAFRKNKVLHHGTILLNSDLNKLNRYLGSEYSGIKTKAVKSAPTEVKNLNISNDEFIRKIKAEFKKLYHPSNNSDFKINNESLSKYLEIRSSDRWIYGTTPNFIISFDNKDLELKRTNIDYSIMSSKINLFKDKFFNLDKFFS